MKLDATGPDEIDRRILRLLQDDCKTSLAKIGEAVGLSAPSVIERIRKLEPVSVTLDEKTFLADPEEKRLYDEAFALIRKADFAAATPALASFLRRYPASGFFDSTMWRRRAVGTGTPSTKNSRRCAHTASKSKPAITIVRST